jgi:hypothetical protein
MRVLRELRALEKRWRVLVRSLNGRGDSRLKDWDLKNKHRTTTILEIGGAVRGTRRSGGV